MSVFNNISKFFRSDSKDKKKLEQSVIESRNNQLEIIRNEVEERTIISRKSIITKLYSLEQVINILKVNYPEKYEEFKRRIEILRVDYEESLKESKKTLTFQIDPDKDFEKISEVRGLETKIQDFINIDMQYDTIAFALQKLIVKLNILYNESIYYYKKEIILEDIKVGISSEIEILERYKEWGKVIGKETEKERISLLFVYLEYLLLKTYIRNSRVFPSESYKFAINDYFIINNMDNNFRDFMLDELTDTSELISKIKDKIFAKSYVERVNKLMKKIISSDNSITFNKEIWNEYLILEEGILSKVVEDNNVPRKDVCVKVLNKFNIDIKEEDLLIKPRINAILSLSGMNYGVEKNDSLVITRFLQVLSNNISYEEIYFLILLFDMLEDIKNKSKNFYSSIKEYDLKYNYTLSRMKEKKESELKRTPKEYYYIFTINDSEEEIFNKYLTKYTLDYYIKDKKVYMNKRYFDNDRLINIKKELEENSKNN